MTDFDHIQEQIDDIMSSGMGGEITCWHEEQLTELISPLPDNDKREVFKLYSDNLLECEGWEMEEVDFIGKLCGVKDIKLSFSFT